MRAPIKLINAIRGDQQTDSIINLMSASGQQWTESPKACSAQFAFLIAA
jgi:hypothetical protein